MGYVQKTYPVEVLTASYQISGEFQPRGNMIIFLNDANVSSLTITNATLMPLMPGARTGAIPSPELYVLKSEVQVLIIGDFPPEEAQLMPKKLPLVCFTDTYAIRATFHVGAETQPADVFSVQSLFLPITDLDIFTLRPLTQEIGGQADLAFIYRPAVRVFQTQ
jgi:hypothetical protein